MNSISPGLSLKNGVCRRAKILHIALLGVFQFKMDYTVGQNVFKLDLPISVYSFVPDLLSLYFKRYIL